MLFRSKEIQDYLEQERSLDDIEEPDLLLKTEYEVHRKLEQLYIKLKKYL